MTETSQECWELFSWKVTLTFLLQIQNRFLETKLKKLLGKCNLHPPVLKKGKLKTIGRKYLNYYLLLLDPRLDPRSSGFSLKRGKALTTLELNLWKLNWDSGLLSRYEARHLDPFPI